MGWMSWKVAGICCGAAGRGRGRVVGGGGVAASTAQPAGRPTAPRWPCSPSLYRTAAEPACAAPLPPAPRCPNLLASRLSTARTWAPLPPAPRRLILSKQAAHGTRAHTQHHRYSTHLGPWLSLVVLQVLQRVVLVVQHLYNRAVPGGTWYRTGGGQNL